MTNKPFNISKQSVLLLYPLPKTSIRHSFYTNSISQCVS